MSLQNFLESSTIHGLAHISTAKSHPARAVWVAIVVTCFSSAIYMITSSYKEWQESPVSTTITTHPITELQFPTVTVCPPRGSNTALNHLLEKVKHVNFTAQERENIFDISQEVFVRIPNKKHAEQMVGLLNTEDMRGILNNQGSLPEIDQENKITIRFEQVLGSFRTPDLESPKNEIGGNKLNRTLHYVLSLPDNIEELVGDGALVVSVHAIGNWSFSRQESRLKLYQDSLKMVLATVLATSDITEMARTGTCHWKMEKY